MDETWEIDDAEVRHRNAPDRHFIPSLAERSGVRVGEQVRFLFFFRGRDEHGLHMQSEHLRVTVQAALASGYVGTLNKSPAHFPLLQEGAAVSFEPRHIVSIHWEPGMASYHA